MRFYLLVVVIDENGANFKDRNIIIINIIQQ